MRLTELEPWLVKLEIRTETWQRCLGDPATWRPGDPTEAVTGPRAYHTEAPSIAEADGIQFLCPKCLLANGGPTTDRELRAHGIHSVVCWQPHVPHDIRPAPGRWRLVGTSMDDLSLVANSSSVKLVGGCQAHFFVTQGEIVMCP